MFGDFGKLMSMAMSLSSTVETAKRELEAKIFTGTAGDASANVCVKISGLGKVQSIQIAPELLNPAQKEELEELVKSAMQTVCDQLREELKGRAKGFAQNLGVPGMGN